MAPCTTSWRMSPARSRFAMYGTDDAIELWAFEPEPVRTTVHSGHDAVTAMAFASDGERFFVGTRDGSVAQWSGAGRHLARARNDP